jgi:hypothetical protein
MVPDPTTAIAAFWEDLIEYPSFVAISTWALFPTTSNLELGVFVPIPTSPSKKECPTTSRGFCGIFVPIPTL